MKAIRHCATFEGFHIFENLSEAGTEGVEMKETFEEDIRGKRRKYEEEGGTQILQREIRKEIGERYPSDCVDEFDWRSTKDEKRRKKRRTKFGFREYLKDGMDYAREERKREGGDGYFVHLDFKPLS